MNPDPLAELDYDWTPYRYGYNNPILYTDPNGLWEFKINEDDDGNLSVTLVVQEGDNLDSLAEQTGFSVDELKEFYNEDIIKGLEEGNIKSLNSFGGYLKGINDALNESEISKCNCWSSALEYGLTGEVDPNTGIDLPGNADRQLKRKFEATDNPRTGDIIRYAHRTGYKGNFDFNDDGEINELDEIIRKTVLFLPASGDISGGTSHYGTFLLKNDQGTQVFSKNGYNVKWQILYSKTLESDYGPETGIKGSSQYFTKKE